MKSRVRRLEEDNQKKEKEIEQLLDPSKSEEMRRTLADRKPDAGTVCLASIYGSMIFGNVVLFAVCLVVWSLWCWVTTS